MLQYMNATMETFGFHRKEKEMQKQQQKQQGDVYFEKITSLPDSCQKVERTERGYVLAYGEVTGHMHVIEHEGVELYEKDNILYARVNAPSVEVKHEEHSPIVLEEGIWEIGRIREYNPFEQEAKFVED